MMRLSFLKTMHYLHARPRRLKTAGWLVLDFYFSYGGFNQVTGRDDDALLFTAIVLALTILCGLYRMPSATFTPKTYATFFSCSLLAVIAYQAMVPVTGAASLTPAQAWGIVIFMLPITAYRVHAHSLFNTVFPKARLELERMQNGRADEQ